MKTHQKKWGIVIALTLLFFLGFAQNEKQIPNPGQQFQKQDNKQLEPYKDKWPELKRGTNGLVQRFVSPKLKQIVINPKQCIAGLFFIKFAEGTHVRLKNGVLTFDEKNAVNNPEEMYRLNRVGLKPEVVVSQLQSISKTLDQYKATHGFEITYMFRDKKQQTDNDQQFIEKAELEQRAGEELADLDLYYVVFAKDFKDAPTEEALMNLLNGYGIVEEIYPAVLAEGATIKKGNATDEFLPPPTADISAQQGYLNAAPNGLDARFAWTRPGGRGDGIKVTDVEWDWVTDHEDFPASANRFWGGRPACVYDYGSTEHGTAVIGVLAAPHNGIGVNGFVPNIRHGLSSTCRLLDYVWASFVATFSGENWGGRAHNVTVSNAMNDAIGGLSAGDVLLVEQHTPGPSTGVPNPGDNQWEYVPMEYYQECFDVIRRATASGIIVVEAGGNGSQNLDAAVYRQRFFPFIRNSQALLVGASNMGDLMPAGFSNSSRRMDVHAWGAGVVTIGYGGQTPTPFDNTPINRFYTRSFGGTSSASPMVAGCVASIQGVRRAAGQLTMTPIDMRNLLVNTGTLQVASTVSLRPIGPQPDLNRAITRSSGMAGGFSGAGLYAIRSKLTNKVLDVDVSWFRGQDDGQRLIQWDWHGGRNQQFLLEDAGGGLFRIKPTHSLKCLDVSGVSVADGANLHQWRLTGGANQLFRIEAVGSFYKIVASNSGKVLDVRAFSRDNGAQIQQWTYLGGDNQLFSFTRL